MGDATSARKKGLGVFVEYNCVLGQGPTAEEATLHEGLMSAARVREPNDCKEFEDSQPLQSGTPSKSIADARRALTWKMVDGKKDPKARLVAESDQCPDLADGLVETSGRVGLRSSHPQVLSL